MIPHPETVCMLGTFDYQERLRDAARHRLAASAQTDVRSPLTRATTALRGVAVLFGGVLPRWRGAPRVRLSRLRPWLA